MPSPPNIETPEGRSALARMALNTYAVGLRRSAKTRRYSGPENAGHRANLRNWAQSAETLSGQLRHGEMMVDHTFAGGES